MELIDKYVPDFSNYLLANTPINFQSYFLLVNEENIHINANPFICTLLAFFLKNNTNVILAASQESLNHYSTILKKFGLNLGSSDKFSLIDLFYSPIKSEIKEELPLSESFPYTYNPNMSKYYYSNTTLTEERNVNFDTLLKNIESQIKKFNNNLKTVVIFDNISILPNSGQTLIDDINNLLKFLSDFNLNLVMNMNKELSGTVIYNYLYNVSDFEIEFKQNESGFSKDMDGQIKLYLKSSQMKEWNLRYSIKDNGISFFPHLIV